MASRNNGGEVDKVPRCVDEPSAGAFKKDQRERLKFTKSCPSSDAKLTLKSPAKIGGNQWRTQGECPKGPVDPKALDFFSD
ncbi:hypothetical protein TNCV_1013801 [Trichonephila clavipes]|uniref:Uncharacterized protein n=1 Tax=Trichonephila clavipes TaxID=2585209 RepID=A0A8X7B9M3_TRICX|nr:hypothetical protein TNCV_1013801 [Trichonephila clavipes]